MVGSYMWTRVNEKTTCNFFRVVSSLQKMYNFFAWLPDYILRKRSQNATEGQIQPSALVIPRGWEEEAQTWSSTVLPEKKDREEAARIHEEEGVPQVNQTWTAGASSEPSLEPFEGEGEEVVAQRQRKVSCHGSGRTEPHR